MLWCILVLLRCNLSLILVVYAVVYEVKDKPGSKSQSPRSPRFPVAAAASIATSIINTTSSILASFNPSSMSRFVKVLFIFLYSIVMLYSFWGVVLWYHSMVLYMYPTGAGSHDNIRVNVVGASFSTRLYYSFKHGKCKGAHGGQHCWRISRNERHGARGKWLV